MDGFKVTPEYVSQAATSCNTTAEEVAQALNQLKVYARSFEATWHGVSASRFQLLMSEYDVCATILHDALVDIGQGLRGNFVNYHESEAANMKQIDAIDTALASARLS